MLSESAEPVAALKGRAGRTKPQLDERRLKRLKYLWEETTTSYKDIVESIGVSKEAIEILVKSIPLKPRRATAMMAKREGELLAILTEAAVKNQTCPTNKEIAQRLGLGLMSVQSWFPRLIRMGVIRSQRVVFTNGRGASMHRIVTIVATGLKTRKPEATDAWYSKPALTGTALEQAKNFVRSRGPMVCDASVVKYGTAGIYVDQALMSVDEFIAKALKMGFVFKPDHAHSALRPSTHPR